MQADRLRQAGATPAEIEALQAVYDRLPPWSQAANDAHYASLDIASIREELLRTRAVEPPVAPKSQPEDKSEATQVAANQATREVESSVGEGGDDTDAQAAAPGKAAVASPRLS